MMSAVVTSPAFINRIETLPPVNPTLERILAVTNSPTASAADIAAVLSTDPTITAKILRIANSPFYGAARKVAQVSRAVVLLGSVAIRNLVTAVCARDAFSSSASNQVEHVVLWRHAIAAASACDLIARRTTYQPPEEAFLGGLLHDIGQLAMISFQPAAFRAAYRDQCYGMRVLSQERAYLGLDHVELGYRILSQWGLPEVLCQVARDHHKEEIIATEGHARLLAVVMLGDTLAQIVGVGMDVSAGTPQRAAAAAAFIKCSEFDQLQVLDGLGSRVEQVLEMFAISDMGQTLEARPVAARVLWVTPESCSVTRNIGQWLLNRCGYKVQSVPENKLAETFKPEDMIVLDFPDRDAAAVNSLGGLLVSKGFRKVALLSDRSAETAMRELDPRTGVCRLPQLFTAFDIRWMETLWRH
jgi:putative nucleotidyltransferase with HDIG domain